jgi:DNA-binding transcriptional MocR family regulator
LRREGQDILNLGASDGFPPLKEALLELLRQDDIPAKDETLLVTDGCQQALDLIAKAFIRSGDTVLLENPTYPGAAAVFNGVRARVLNAFRPSPNPEILWASISKRSKRHWPPIA